MTRHALITGASSDLGHATAHALAADGWTLTLTGRSAARLAPLADLGTLVSGDLTDPAFRVSLTQTPFTGFVHVAANYFEYKRFHLTADDAETIAQRIVDYDAPLDLLTRILPEMMAARFGRVVVVSSLAAQVAGPGATRYSAHKAALEALTRGLAVEYGRFGVTANAVAPGFIATSRLTARLADDALALRRLADQAALKRIATPAEVAAAIAFLMSPAASYITGITLPVTGGLHLNTSW